MYAIAISFEIGIFKNCKSVVFAKLIGSNATPNPLFA